MLHVDAELVGSAGLRVESDEREASKSLGHFIKGLGGATIVSRFADLHFLANLGVNAHVGFNPITVEMDLAPDNRLILFFDGALFELPRQFVVNLIVLRDDEDSTCVFVETVDDPGAKLSGTIAQLIEVKLKR